MSYLETGVVDVKEIKIPSEARFMKGPVVIIECVQRIPCNPCVDSCPRGAIKINGSINNIPEVDFQLCNGCGVCISNCPGLAIFVIDKTYSEERATVSIPYEFLPLPEKGERVDLLDRSGKVCGKGEIVRIRNAKIQDRTPVVTIAVDKDLVMQVRFFKRRIDERKTG